MTKDSILIVDDQRFNIEVLSNLLDSDYDLGIAMDGATALRLVKNYPPDLILLDVNLPDINGYEICRQLKADPVSANIPLIFLTGLSDETDEVTGLNLGAVDYIAKPFSPALVKARIANVLKLSHSAREISLQQERMAQQEKMVSLGMLMASIAHELNTPIGNVVLANSFMLEQMRDVDNHIEEGSLSLERFKKFSLEVGQSLQLVQRNVGRAVDLINSIKKIFNDDKEEVLSTVVVHKKVEEVILLNSAGLQGRSCVATVFGPQELKFRTYSKAFEQMIALLLEFSIKQTFQTLPGQISIRFGFNETGELFLEYEDNGMGTVEDRVPLLIESSVYSSDLEHSLSLEIFGLYSLVKNRLKGSIQSYSVNERGIKYLVTLPFDSDSDDSSA